MTLRLIFSVLLYAICLAIAPAQAQQYPSKPIRLIVPFTPGATNDLVGRVTAEYLSRKTGQSVIVENRPGAGGNVGSSYVAKSDPDGYTLLVVTRDPIVVNPFIYKNMPFDPLTDLVPVAPLGETPQLIVVNSKFPAKTLREVIEQAKKEPGKLSYGSPGVGSTPHLGADRFARLAGIQLLHVPYRGMAPAVNDLVSGEIQLLVSSTAPVLGFVQAGTLNVLAAASPKRLSFWPDVPTAAEAGVPNFELSTWFGLLAPKGTPTEVVDRLNGLITDIAQDAPTMKRWDENFIAPMPLSPSQFSDLVRKEYAYWQQAVRDAGLQPQ